jgi:copper chaperone NosL
MTLFHRICLVVSLALSLAACGGQPNGPQPPDLVYGQDVCDECGMIISEARFAAATLLQTGEFRKFESIADMVAFHMERPDQQVRAWFVHDYSSESWIRAETAFYVVSDQVHSPMPPGVAAFENQEMARDLAASLGVNVLAFEDMRLAVHLVVHG